MIWQVYLFITVLTWGGYSILFKFALGKTDFMSLMFIVGLTQFLITSPFVIWRGINYSIEGVGISILLGVFTLLGGWSFLSALALGVPVSVATPIYGVGVLLLSVAAGFFLKEPMSLKLFVGIFFGALSIVILTKKGG
jgi:drug/metabolite transporter (DMT)-like permease